MQQARNHGLISATKTPPWTRPRSIEANCKASDAQEAEWKAQRPSARRRRPRNLRQVPFCQPFGCVLDRRRVRARSVVSRCNTKLILFNDFLVGAGSH